METNASLLKNMYSCREEEIRATLSLDECIRRIKNVYNSGYDSNTLSFDAWDQLLACEALAASAPLFPPCNEGDKVGREESVNVSGSGVINGGCKHIANFEPTSNKQKVITELRQCNYRTDPIKVANLLEEFFHEWPSKTGHWLYIAQHYPPRRINLTLNSMIKNHVSGRTTIHNPAAYFTNCMKYRAKRKDPNKERQL